MTVNATQGGIANKTLGSLRFAKHAWQLVFAVLNFLVSGRSSAEGFRAMLWLHCRTNGTSTALIIPLLGVFRPRVSIARNDRADMWQGLSSQEKAKLVSELESEGCSILPQALSEEVCRRLRIFAKTTAANPWDANGGIHEKEIYDPDHKFFAKYQFDAEDLVANPDIQALIATPTLLEIVQDYLGCAPILDEVNMWWSLRAETSSSEIAQQFHFDFDRTKWVKVFFYLTDVQADTGPHVYVRHSHKREARRAPLFKRGYVRLSDSDIGKVYGTDEVVEIYGDAGTALFVDTSGFHKGKPPSKDNRLILELQFSNCSLGATYPSVGLHSAISESLRNALLAYPQIYRQLSIDPSQD